MKYSFNLTVKMFYFVAGPIGNLGDLTLRAKEVLESVDYILAEDTRRTKNLLSHYNINKKVVCFNQRSNNKIQDIVFDLRKGSSIALLSDAGTPGLCDPGGLLAESFLKEGIEFTALPGPSSLTMLISLAPYSCSTFLFMGYFPKKKGREKIISIISELKYPIFFFESPHRIAKTLYLLQQKIPENYILIGRELTKKFEEVVFCRLSELDLSKIREQGEFVFAISPPCQTKKNNT